MRSTSSLTRSGSGIATRSGLSSTKCVSNRRTSTFLYSRARTECICRSLQVFGDYIRSCLNGNLLTKADDGRLRSQWEERDRKPHIWDVIRQPPTSTEAIAERARLDREIARAAALITGRDGARTGSAGPSGLPGSSRPSRPAVQDGQDGQACLADHQLPSPPRTPRIRRPTKRAVSNEETILVASSRQKKSKTSQAPAVVSVVTDDCTVSPIKEPRLRLNGPPLHMTDEQYAETLLPLTPIPAESACPPLQGLLYRYHNENSRGVNSERGFIAGRFRYNNISPPPAPSSTDLHFCDLENHLNRNRVDSPFWFVLSVLLFIILSCVRRSANLYGLKLREQLVRVLLFLVLSGVRRSADLYGLKLDLASTACTERSTKGRTQWPHYANQCGRCAGDLPCQSVSPIASPAL